jgi:Ca2+/Na+ antiporter
LKSADFSFGHLVGSAVSNVLVLALLTFFTTIDLTVSWRYYVLMCFMLLTVAAISWFYVSKKSFDRWEGIALLFLYFAFVFYEIFL